MGKNADDTGSTTPAGESGNTSINTLTSDDGNDVMGDDTAYGIGEKNVHTAQQAPLAEAVFRYESNDRHDDIIGSHERPAEELDADNSSNNSALHAQTLHGHPIMISQCIFQAHIGRYSKSVFKLELYSHQCCCFDVCPGGCSSPPVCSVYIVITTRYKYLVAPRRQK